MQLEILNTNIDTNIDYKITFVNIKTRTLKFKPNESQNIYCRLIQQQT